MNKLVLCLCCIFCLTSVSAQKINKDFFLDHKLSDEKAKETFLSDNDLPYFLYKKAIKVKDRHFVVYEYYLDGPPESSIYLGVFDSFGFPISYCKVMDCELDCPDDYSVRICDGMIEVRVVYIQISDEVFEKYYDKLSQIQKSMPFGQRSIIKGLVTESEKEIVEKKYIIDWMRMTSGNFFHKRILV